MASELECTLFSPPFFFWYVNVKLLLSVMVLGFFIFLKFFVWGGCEGRGEGTSSICWGD